jgi:hypothetical protein
MSVTRVAGSRDGRYGAVEAPGLVVEPGRIEDDDAVWRGRQEPGEPELAERARHDLPDRPDRVGQLRLGDMGDETVLGTLRRGGEVEQVRGDPLLHGAERVDRRLLQRCRPGLRFSSSARAKATRAFDERRRVEVEQARCGEGPCAEVERPPDDERDPQDLATARVRER